MKHITLRGLYSAPEGVDLPPDLPITSNTPEDALFMERVNDISFVFADVLVVVFEHQSTVNPNMPLRCLMYLARLYEKIINNRDVYKSKLLTIPRDITTRWCGGAKRLKEYSEFIGKAREYEQELGSPEAGVKAAVKYCISQGILNDNRHKSGIVIG
jgi:hypothetical protein